MRFEWLSFKHLGVIFPGCTFSRRHFQFSLENYKCYFHSCEGGKKRKKKKECLDNYCFLVHSISWNLNLIRIRILK